MSDLILQGQRNYRVSGVTCDSERRTTRVYYPFVDPANFGSSRRSALAIAYNGRGFIKGVDRSNGMIGTIDGI